MLLPKNFILSSLITGLLFCLVSKGFAANIDPETPADAQPASGGVGWNLEWSDEFNGTTLDTTKWTKNNSTTSRTPRSSKGIDYWYWKPQNTYLDGLGNLILKVTKENSNTMYCGSVNSNNKYEPTYGYFEARIENADTAKASHTAFWFQGDNMGNIDGTGNDGAEIDVYESAWVGDYTKSVVHIDGYGTSHQANTKQWNASGIHDGYHTYGLEWTHDYLKIYYDGQLKVQYTDSKWVPWVAEYLWLSDGASFGDGDFISQSIGYLTEAKVDYIRVWKYSDVNLPTMVDDTSGSITYTGGWGTWTGNPTYMGTEHYSNNTGAKATFSFTGTKSLFYASLRKDLGIANIYLDGDLVDTVDCYRSTSKYIQNVYESPFLAYGPHTLAVEVTGNYNPNATNNDGEIIVDAFGYSVLTDTVAPDSPANLTAVNGNKSISLDWDDNTEYDFDNYIVYRSKTLTGPFSAIASDVQTSDYNDITIESDTRYYYFVTAEDYSNNESANSNTISMLNLFGDIDNNGKVDLYDIAKLGAEWMTTYDYYDLADLSDDWLSQGHLVVHLPLNGDANNASGYEFNGVVYGDTVWDPCGYIDGAVQLDGSGDYIEIPQYAGIVGTQSRTVTAWFKTGYNLSQIISWGGSQNGSKWVVQLDILGRLQLDVGGSIATCSEMLNDNQWHHIAVVLDNDGTPNLNEVQFYIDGQPAIANAADVPINTTAGENVKIGVYSPNPKYFNGLLDDVRIYDRALSTQEIEILAQ